MTGSVACVGSSSPTLDGRMSRLGPGLYLCRFRLPTSMPIPLAVVSPADVELATWAFAGMKPPAHQPTCLLLVRPLDTAAASALANGTRLVVSTHFHDITVSTGAAETSDGLSPDERDVAARAILSSVTAASVAALADLIALLTPTLRALPVAKDAPVLTIVDDRIGLCIVSGTDVPNYIVFDCDAGTWCVRVAAARVSFVPKARMDLDLEAVWGTGGRPTRAILVGNDRFATARLHAAGA